MRRLLMLMFVLLTASGSLMAEQGKFNGVKIHRHRSARNRVLVDKVGTLKFDDSAHELTFKSDAADHVAIAYDDVVKVVFDVTTHMRAGVEAALLNGAPFPGGIAAIAIAKGHVNTYWFYLDYKDHSEDKSVLFEVPKDASAEVIAEARQVFGSRVTEADFTEVGAPIRLEDLGAIKSKQEMKVDKHNHPMPQLQPDKATVVVACPPLAARNAGRGNQFKLHANNEVVAVNRMGTYGFAYLEPGKYRLASQAEDASGFEMELEAGHEYFFVQNTFMGFSKARTTLSRNSPELVMYLVDGSYYSVWKTKVK